MQSPPSRRQVLQVVSTLSVGLAGCVSGAQEDDAERGNPTQTPSELPNTSSTLTGTPSDVDPCMALAQAPKATSTDTCPDVEVTFISPEKRTRGEVQTRTPGDHLVIRVQTEGEQVYELIGCVDSDSGKEGFSEKVPAEKGIHEFNVVNYPSHSYIQVVVWIQGCKPRTYYDN